jgi:hypothetical protein
VTTSHGESAGQCRASPEGAAGASRIAGSALAAPRLSAGVSWTSQAERPHAFACLSQTSSCCWSRCCAIWQKASAQARRHSTPSQNSSP